MATVKGTDSQRGGQEGLSFLESPTSWHRPSETRSPSAFCRAPTRSASLKGFQDQRDGFCPLIRPSIRLFHARGDENHRRARLELWRALWPARSRPIPGMCMSMTLHAASERAASASSSEPEANVRARRPSERSRRPSDRRTEESSSTTWRTGGIGRIQGLSPAVGALKGRTRFRVPRASGASHATAEDPSA